MANRQERREAEKANEAASVATDVKFFDAQPITVNEAGDLLAMAQREIETLQQQRAADRDMILALQLREASALDPIASPLLSRVVAADELDADPIESPGGVAYDAGLRAGMLRAAMICETRWAGEIGNHCAHSIREAEEKIR